jgi:hypothetical protein
MYPYQRGDQAWMRLIRDYGQPLSADFFSAEEVAQAAQEGRVVRIERWSDGFGSGDVVMQLMDTNLHDQSTLRLRGSWHHTWVFVVFEEPLVLDDDQQVLLAGGPNSWERLSEIPAIQWKTQP